MDRKQRWQQCHGVYWSRDASDYADYGWAAGDAHVEWDEQLGDAAVRHMRDWHFSGVA
jgi:ADP-ribose pyrophosphatase YjhB (NUDIX family)